MPEWTHTHAFHLASIFSGVRIAHQTIAWKMYVCVIDEKSNVKFGRNLIHQSRVA